MKSFKEKDKTEKCDGIEKLFNRMLPVFII